MKKIILRLIDNENSLLTFTNIWTLLHYITTEDSVLIGFLLGLFIGTILTQGGETPGGAGVAATLATGFPAAALTHARPRDSAAG